MPTIYLLHFRRPYKHARHYIGVTKGPLAKRLKRHRAGNGANLVRVAAAAGITFHLVRAWHNAPQAFETKLKRMGGATQLCPHCAGPRAFKRGRVPDPE